MKYIVFILIAYCSFICSCHREVRVVSAIDNTPIKSIDTTAVEIQGEHTFDGASSDSIDSLIISRTLMAALDTIRNSKQRSEISYTIEDNQVEVINVHITSSNYFTNTREHIIVHMQFYDNHSAFLCSKEKDSLRVIASDKQVYMYHEGDTIFDVNGDGLKDFVTNWYGMSGCCLKGFSHVYLARDKNYGSFSKQFDFINPTFSPKEHIVRGICYGHPGDTEMYKCRWSGDTLETVEYVMNERDSLGQWIGIIISKEQDNEEEHIIRRQKAVPNEYLSIKDYGWFVGD